MQFPEDVEGFSIENQVYLGDTGLLIHPVVKQDAKSVDVYIGESEVRSHESTLTRLTTITLTTHLSKAREGIQLPHHLIRFPCWSVGAV